MSLGFPPLGVGKISGGSGGSGSLSPPDVTDYTNGFALPGSTYSGGPTVVADNEGTLVTSPAGVLPIEGMRLATTVAKGATLGPELWPSSGITVSGATANGDGSFTIVGASGYVLYANAAFVVGRNYRVTCSLGSYASGSVLFRSSGQTAVKTSTLTAEGVLTEDYTVPADGTTQMVYAFSSLTGVLSNISVREVIPTWLPTDSSGDPIHASTPLRTTKGTVSKYAESYKGPLIEPARTNYFLNSTVPVTQNITTTARQYTVSVKGTGSITLSGTATGVATEGSPLTVTATAGTLTCTVAGTLSRVNVEAGAFGTSFITTGATTLTRPAANLTRPTAGTALESGNNFAIYGRVVPKAGGQSKTLFSSYLNTTHYFEVYTLSGITVSIRKAIGGANIYKDKSYTQVAGIPFEYLAYNHSVYGMGVAVKQDGGSWLVFSENTYGQSVTLPVTYQIGASNNANHFAGNYPFTEIIKIPASVEPQAWLMDQIAKGRI